MPSATLCICQARSFHTSVVQTPMLTRNGAVSANLVGLAEARREPGVRKSGTSAPRSPERQLQAVESSILFDCDGRHCRAGRDALSDQATGRNRYLKVVPDAPAAPLPERPLPRPRPAFDCIVGGRMPQAGSLPRSLISKQPWRRASPPQREAGDVVELGPSARKLSHRRLDAGDPLGGAGAVALSWRAGSSRRSSPNWSASGSSASVTPSV